MDKERIAILHAQESVLQNWAAHVWQYLSRVSTVGVTNQHTFAFQSKVHWLSCITCGFNYFRFSLVTWCFGFINQRGLFNLERQWNNFALTCTAICLHLCRPFAKDLLLLGLSSLPTTWYHDYWLHIHHHCRVRPLIIELVNTIDIDRCWNLIWLPCPNASHSPGTRACRAPGTAFHSCRDLGQHQLSFRGQIKFICRISPKKKWSKIRRTIVIVLDFEGFHLFWNTKTHSNFEWCLSCMLSIIHLYCSRVLISDQQTKT